MAAILSTVICSERIQQGRPVLSYWAVEGLLRVVVPAAVSSSSCGGEAVQLAAVTLLGKVLPHEGHAGGVKAGGLHLTVCGAADTEMERDNYYNSIIIHRSSPGTKIKQTHN